jgi:hypothetical protein
MFILGHIDPFWNIEYRELSYSRNSFNNQEDVDKWNKYGYTNKYFTGKMYVASEIDTWAKPFFNIFPGNHTGVTFYKMETGIIMPMHKDMFSFFIKKYNIVDRSKIKRALIFLEDWKSGHIFEVEDRPISNWKAGDYIIWDMDTFHLAANIGIEDRYTAQITYLDV